MSPLIGTIVQALAGDGVDLGALGLAWARVLPSVTLVPAFGLRALPPPARAVLGLAFAACVWPAIGWHEGASPTALVPWAFAALSEVARGLPVAIAAAVPLWAATMAGGVADALRGSQETPNVSTVEGTATPLGVALSLLASAMFLASGGPARVLDALATRGPGSHPVLAAANDLTAGITMAVALGGPLLAASVVVEVAAAMVARSASPAQVHALIAPLRALGTLAVTGVVLGRLASALARAVVQTP